MSNYDRINELIDKKDGQTSNLTREEVIELDELLEEYDDNETGSTYHWTYNPAN